MITTAVFDTKPYDREALQKAQPTMASNGTSSTFASRKTQPPGQRTFAQCASLSMTSGSSLSGSAGKARVELVAHGCAGFNDVELRRGIETYGNASSCRAARCRRTCCIAAAHAEPQDPSRIQARTRAELFAQRTGEVPQLLEKQGDSKLETRPELNLPRDKCNEENGAEQPKQPGFGGIAPSD